MNKHFDKLEQFTETLEESYNKVYSQIKSDFPDTDPHLIRDTHGRPLLLEALTELVSAQKVLCLTQAVSDDDRVPKWYIKFGDGNSQNNQF